VRADSSVNLRRAYFDCRYGQLHARTAFPNTGGFDERTPLVLLHPSPLSSRTFAPLLPVLGTDRSLYAVDTPGSGESDPPAHEPSIADCAAAIGDLLDGLRLREVDLLGYHTGSAIAAEVAIARPKQVRRVVLVGLPVFDAAERATMHWPAATRLPLVGQLALVLRPKDDLWEHTLRGRALLPQARWCDLPEYGFGLFDVASEAVARELRAFLDAA
jgi:pimeloyl-ACP methyl ester carboxylesterase